MRSIERPLMVGHGPGTSIEPPLNRETKMCGKRFVGFAAGAIVLWSSQAFGQMDLRGAWSQRLHEDAAERGPGSEIGDYLGLPIKMRQKCAQTPLTLRNGPYPNINASRIPADYAPHGPANLWIDSELDPQSFEVIAYKITYSWMTPTKIIWMIGWPSAPARGGSAYLDGLFHRRMGRGYPGRNDHTFKGGLAPPQRDSRDDYARVTEYFMRRGHFLTVVMAIEDPVYMTEPLVRSWNLELNRDIRWRPIPVRHGSRFNAPRAS